MVYQPLQIFQLTHLITKNKSENSGFGTVVVMIKGIDKPNM